MMRASKASVPRWVLTLPTVFSLIIVVACMSATATQEKKYFDSIESGKVALNVAYEAAGLAYKQGRISEPLKDKLILYGDLIARVLVLANRDLSRLVATRTEAARSDTENTLTRAEMATSIVTAISTNGIAADGLMQVKIAELRGYVEAREKFHGITGGGN